VLSNELSGPIRFAVFGTTKQDWANKVLEIGLLKYERSMFFVMRIGRHFFVDMPYVQKQGVEVPAKVEGMGFWTSVSLCDDAGICQSFRVRTITYEMSSAFIDGIAEQVSSGLTEAEHGSNIIAAYEKWKDPRQMFQATTIRDSGWTTEVKEKD